MAKRPSKNIALILLGGSGERFGEQMPKQFIQVFGKPLFYYAIACYEKAPEIDEIVIVSKPGLCKMTYTYCQKLGFRKIKGIYSGGQTRRESVLLGLRGMKESGLADKWDTILIADGDRPIASHEVILNNIEAVKLNMAAVTVSPSTDSIVYSQSSYFMEKSLDRNNVYLAKTPQSFRFDDILYAHEKINKSRKANLFTDDASIYLQVLKKTPTIVIDEGPNIKITTKADMKLFISILGDGYAA